MTEMKLPTPANDNLPSGSIAQEQASAKGGVLTIITWLAEPTKKVLEMLGFWVDTRHPSVILEEKQKRAQAMNVLTAANDNVEIKDEITQEAA